MKLTQIAILAVTALAIGGAVVAFNGERGGQELPQLPQTPQIQPIELLEATPFTLVEPRTHFYRSEQPSYSAGTLVVLRMDPRLLVPRQTYENVVYVGSETAERVNVGENSGILVAIVPGRPDLANAPIFLGEPELPERIDAQEAQRQLGLAVERGAQGAGAIQAQAAQKEPVELFDGYELLRFASYQVERFAGDEQDLIQGLRAPRIGG